MIVTGGKFLRKNKNNRCCANALADWYFYPIAGKCSLLYDKHEKYCYADFFHLDLNKAYKRYLV